MEREMEMERERERERERREHMDRQFSMMVMSYVHLTTRGQSCKTFFFFMTEKKDEWNRVFVLSGFSALPNVCE